MIKGVRHEHLYQFPFIFNIEVENILWSLGIYFFDFKEKYILRENKIINIPLWQLGELRRFILVVITKTNERRKLNTNKYITYKPSSFEIKE